MAWSNTAGVKTHPYKSRYNFNCRRKIRAGARYTSASKNWAVSESLMMKKESGKGALKAVQQKQGGLEVHCTQGNLWAIIKTSANNKGTPPSQKAKKRNQESKNARNNNKEAHCTQGREIGRRGIQPNKVYDSIAGAGRGRGHSCYWSIRYEWRERWS